MKKYGIKSIMQPDFKFVPLSQDIDIKDGLDMSKIRGGYGNVPSDLNKAVLSNSRNIMNKNSKNE